MTAAIQTQLAAVATREVRASLGTLSDEYIARRALSVGLEAAEATAWARERYGTALLRRALGQRIPFMAPGRRASDAPGPPVRSAMTPTVPTTNCPTCIGLGCGECCGTGRALA